MGENGREKVEGWVPRWLRFPPSAYTDRGGVNSVERWSAVAELFEPQPEPEPPLQGVGAVAVEGGAEVEAAPEPLSAVEPDEPSGPELALEQESVLEPVEKEEPQPGLVPETVREAA